MFLKESEKNSQIINSNGNLQGNNINSSSFSLQEGAISNVDTHIDEHGNANNFFSTPPNEVISDKILNFESEKRYYKTDNSFDLAEENDSQSIDESEHSQEGQIRDDNDNIDDLSDSEKDVQKKDCNSEDTLFHCEDSERSYSSTDASPVNGIYEYDVSDSEDSCIQDVNEMPFLPRGIHNPNYPGFQHLAYTLQDYSPEVSEGYENSLFSNVYIHCKDEEELLKLTLGHYHRVGETNNDICAKEYDYSDDDEGISTKCHDLDDSEYLRDVSSDSAIFDNRETDFSQDDTCMQLSSLSTADEYIASYIDGEFQDDLISLRRDIYDIIQKPLAIAVESVGEVIDTVIRRIVECQNKYDIDIWNTLSQETIHSLNKNLLNKMETDNTETTDRGSGENISNISDSGNFSLHESNCESNNILLETELNTVDAYITNVKEELFRYDDVKKRIYDQMDLETEEFIPKPIQHIPKDDELENITNGVVSPKTDNNFNTKRTLEEINTDLNQNCRNIHKQKEKNDGSTFRIFSCSAKKSQQKKSKSVRVSGGFDVYNIETAMPAIDMDVIENHLRAAREEERRRRNDREEIRRSLALGGESEDFYRYGDRPGRKPSLQSRLQSGMNLQICFMNESASDTDSPSEGENVEDDEESTESNGIEDKCRELSNMPLNNITKSKLCASVKDLKGAVRPSTLPLNDMARPTTTPNISSQAAFFECQVRLQTEARMALAQAKELAHMQMEVERSKWDTSPITEMLRNSLLKAGVKLSGDRRRVSRQMLTDMNVTQLQVIVNELHTQIEYLNDHLVKLLIARDELHMGQDSMLVDIEDLTRYLSAKDMSIRNMGDNSPHSGKDKSQIKYHLTSLLDK